MFDWDEDYEQLVESRKLAMADSPKAAVAEVPRSHKSKWLFGLALLACGGYVAQQHLRAPAPVPDWMTASLMPVSFATVTELPPGLTVMEPPLARQFKADLKRFSASELAQYADTTRADLRAAAPYMREHLADALVLISYELTRRGL